MGIAIHAIGMTLPLWLKITHFESAARDHELARQVAEHKSMFFTEKDANGDKIDYFRATSGQLQLIPQGPSFGALARDYTAMLEDGLLAIDQPSFVVVMANCETIQDKVNGLTLKE